MTKKLTLEEFIYKANQVHSNKYDYSSVEYINNITKIKITCQEHGIFEQSPDKHLQKRGCPTCAKKQRGLTRRDSKETFIQRARDIHGNLYDYSLSNFQRYHDKIEIICQKHGSFYQKPIKHLTGQGCPKCAQNKKSYTRDGFIELAGNRLCTFYILKCFNNNEIFYKIGITSLTVKERYSRKASMPYTYEIVKIIEDKADIIWDLESNLKTNLISNYQPQIYFEGSLTECYSDLDEILFSIN